MNAGRHLFLTGYRAVGKTTVAEILADRLDRPWIDLDQWIVQRRGETIAEIFARGGERAFRDIESAALRTVVAEPEGVVSLGGGTILCADNRWLIRDSGPVVWLTAAAETIASRIEQDAASIANRPALTDQGLLAEVTELLSHRDPLYREVADLVVSTETMTPVEIADEIVRWWGREGGGGSTAMC